MTDTRCKDCKWWNKISEEKEKEAEKIQKKSIGSSGAGYCHYGLPQCVCNIQPELENVVAERGFWPLTYGEEYCSKFTKSVPY